MRRILITIMLIISLLTTGLVTGCSDLEKGEVNAPDMVHLGDCWGVEDRGSFILPYELRVKSDHADATFTFMTDHGTLWDGDTLTGDLCGRMTVSQNERVCWYPTYNLHEREYPVFIEITAEENGNIIGYAVVKVWRDRYNIMLAYTVKSVTFSKTDGETVPREEVSRRIAKTEERYRDKEIELPSAYYTLEQAYETNRINRQMLLLYAESFNEAPFAKGFAIADEEENIRKDAAESLKVRVKDVNIVGYLHPFLTQAGVVVENAKTSGAADEWKEIDGVQFHYTGNYELAVWFKYVIE